MRAPTETEKPKTTGHGTHQVLFPQYIYSTSTHSVQLLSKRMHRLSGTLFGAFLAWSTVLEVVIAERKKERPSIVYLKASSAVSLRHPPRVGEIRVEGDISLLCGSTEPIEIGVLLGGTVGQLVHLSHQAHNRAEVAHLLRGCCGRQLG